MLKIEDFASKGIEVKVATLQPFEGFDSTFNDRAHGAWFEVVAPFQATDACRPVTGPKVTVPAGAIFHVPNGVRDMRDAWKFCARVPAAGSCDPLSGEGIHFQL